MIALLDLSALHYEFICEIVTLFALENLQNSQNTQKFAKFAKSMQICAAYSMIKGGGGGDGVGPALKSIGGDRL